MGGPHNINRQGSRYTFKHPVRIVKHMPELRLPYFGIQHSTAGPLSQTKPYLKERGVEACFNGQQRTKAARAVGEEEGRRKKQDTRWQSDISQ